MIVDVASVEAELDRIQRELASSEVRTSLFNLVVFSPDAGQTMANEALNELLGKRAARVIHIVGSAEPESRLDVSARCFVDAERKSVCFQEIVISNGTDGAGGSPGSWVPLLLREIPTIVLWMDTIGDKTTMLSHACQQADKLLLDSEHSVALGDSEDAVLRVMRRIAVDDGLPVSDFAFRRLEPVQKLMALAFDDPRRTSLLDEIQAVRISGLEPISGRLLSLWLSSRLGWRPVESHADRFPNGESTWRYHDRQGRDIVVGAVGDRSDGPVEVNLHFPNHEPINIVTEPGGCADVDCSEGESLHPVVTIPGNGELLLQEVDLVSGDALLRGALSVFRV